jgi:hypothetical protein
VYSQQKGKIAKITNRANPLRGRKYQILAD